MENVNELDSSQVIDAFKEYIASRFKSPFVASFIVSWVWFNRVIFFGIFNFDNEATLGNKLSWMHAQVVANQLKVTGDFYINGLLMTVIYSIFCGYIIMILSNVIINLSKGSYLWISNISNSFLAKISNEQFIPVEEHRILFDKKQRAEDQNEVLQNRLYELTNNASKDRESKETMEIKIRELTLDLQRKQDEAKRDGVRIDNLINLAGSNSDAPYFVNNSFEVDIGSRGEVEIKAVFQLVSSKPQIQQLRVIFMGKNRGTFTMEPDMGKERSLGRRELLNLKLKCNGRLREDEKYELAFKYQINETDFYDQRVMFTISMDILKMNSPMNIPLSQWLEDG